jgi:putative transposase
MSKPHYLWRQLTPKQRTDLLAWRKERGQPWHSPSHRPNFGRLRFLISAACYEHHHHIGRDPQRMEDFSRDLLAAIRTNGNQTLAWCILPNHYHALVETPDAKGLLHELGLLHGRTSYAWNGEEKARGQKVFFRTVERAMRSDRHYLATLNYVHHNPVRHGYVDLWTDWPWSSAAEYLAQTGVAEAKRIWKEYSIRDYGKDWDQPGI